MHAARGWPSGAALRPVGALVAVVLVVGCTASASASPSPEASAPAARQSRSPEPSADTSAALPDPVEHRIGVRVVDGAGELFDRETGERFVARGANLVRLSGGAHSTLNPSSYDPDRLDAALAAMAAEGFNVVRVFLNSRPGGMPGDNAAALSDAYFDNVVDLLHRAQAHRMLVLLTLDWLPENASWAFSGTPMIDNVNAMYLSPEGVATNERFFGELALALVRRQAPLDALLAYELRNELYFTDAHPPFSLASGTVETANGGTYDLAVDAERRALLEENLVDWIDRMRSSILAVDPTALVTIGFFQPHGPNRSREGDDRLIETRLAITESTADFIDLHGYPGGELDLGQIVENFGLPRVTEKPILLGEFGAEHGPYPTVDDAVRALVEWQVVSCHHGFDGWLMWTWDTLEQPEFWTATHERGAIARALAPMTRPDPCSSAGLDLATELARDAVVSASAPGIEGPAANAVDGLPETTWSSGADAPQWIELDLGGAVTVESVRLLVAQHPAGGTTHLVTMRGPNGVEVASFTLSGATADGDWLAPELDGPVEGVRFVRVDTSASTSWVAWREISVLGTPGGG